MTNGEFDKNSFEACFVIFKNFLLSENFKKSENWPIFQFSQGEKF